MVSSDNALARVDDQAMDALMSRLSEADRADVDRMVTQLIVAGREPENTPKAIIYGAAVFARTMGLDLALGHVLIWKGRKSVGDGDRKQWLDTHQFFVPADGWIAYAGQFRDAAGNQLLVGVKYETLDPQERRDLLIDKPLARRCLIYRRDWKQPAEGIGTADPKNPHGIRTGRDGKPYGGNPIEMSDPLAMADSRAIRHAMRRAFPMSENVVRTAQRAIREMEDSGVQVNLGEAAEEARQIVVEYVEPPQVPTDDWRWFWQTARDAGVDKATVYERIESATNQSLDFTDPSTGEIEKSMRAFDGTPRRAALLANLIDTSGNARPPIKAPEQVESEAVSDSSGPASDEAEETEMTGSNAALVDTARAFDRFNDRLKAAPNDSNLKAIGAEIKLAVGRGELTGPDMLELRETATARLHDLKQRAAATAG